MDRCESRHRTVLYHKVLFVHCQCPSEESVPTRSLICRNRVARAPWLEDPCAQVQIGKLTRPLQLRITVNCLQDCLRDIHLKCKTLFHHLAIDSERKRNFGFTVYFLFSQQRVFHSSGETYQYSNARELFNLIVQLFHCQETSFKSVVYSVST